MLPFWEKHSGTGSRRNPERSEAPAEPLAEREGFYLRDFPQLTVTLTNSDFSQC